MKLITIFTPSYNRAFILPRLYDSLCRQTNNNFVWSIVDDGSSDNTEDLVNNWIKKKEIEINYTKVVNGGKMRAHNFGVKNCNTSLFVCVDSDDYVCDNFIESVIHNWQEIKNRDELAGMIAYKSFKEDDKYSIKCEFPYKGNSTLSNLYKNGFYGDTTLVFKTNVIKQFPFLEIEGEKFSTEAYAYDQIDQKYQYLLVDEAWTLCEYLPDGYSQTEKMLYKNNPKGWAIFFNQKVKFIDAYLNKSKMGYSILYMIFARRADFRNIYSQSELKTPLYPLIWILSYFYEWKWKNKYPK